MLHGVLFCQHHGALLFDTFRKFLSSHIGVLQNLMQARFPCFIY
jgi:hypothetical protein